MKITALARLILLVALVTTGATCGGRDSEWDSEPDVGPSNEEALQEEEVEQEQREMGL